MRFLALLTILLCLLSILGQCKNPPSPQNLAGRLKYKNRGIAAGPAEMQHFGSRKPVAVAIHRKVTYRIIPDPAREISNQLAIMRISNRMGQDKAADHAKGSSRNSPRLFENFLFVPRSPISYWTDLLAKARSESEKKFLSGPNHSGSSVSEYPSESLEGKDSSATDQEAEELKTLKKLKKAETEVKKAEEKQKAKIKKLKKEKQQEKEDAKKHVEKELEEAKARMEEGSEED